MISDNCNISIVKINKEYLTNFVTSSYLNHYFSTNNFLEKNKLFNNNS